MNGFYAANLLQQRRFLVTGATGGAGSRTAIELSRVGATLCVMGREGDKVERLRRDLHGSGHTSWVLSKDTKLSFDEAGPFDGIFHAAGIEHIGALPSQSYEAFDKVLWPSAGMGVELLACAASRKHNFVKDGGSIVFMSSVAAIRGQTGMSLYCASKAAIEGMVRAAAVELAPRRIRVNAIRAGAFASPMHTRITQRSTPDAIDHYARQHLLGFGRAEDIANAAVFLLADTGKWITGSTMEVDGGYSAK